MRREPAQSFDLCPYNVRVHSTLAVTCSGEVGLAFSPLTHSHPPCGACRHNQRTDLMRQASADPLVWPQLLAWALARGCLFILRGVEPMIRRVFRFAGSGTMVLACRRPQDRDPLWSFPASFVPSFSASNGSLCPISVVQPAARHGDHVRTSFMTHVCGMSHGLHHSFALPCLIFVASSRH